MSQAWKNDLRVKTLKIVIQVREIFDLNLSKFLCFRFILVL